MKRQSFGKWVRIMKRTSVLLITLLAVFGFSISSMSTSQCSNQYKTALIDNEFEFAYHSGASSTSIVEALFNACGRSVSIEKECAKLIKPNEGSIVYLYFASCVHEKVKKDCDRYHQNR